MFLLTQLLVMPWLDSAATLTVLESKLFTLLLLVTFEPRTVPDVEPRGRFSQSCTGGHVVPRHCQYCGFSK